MARAAPAAGSRSTAASHAAGLYSHPCLVPLRVSRRQRRCSQPIRVKFWWRAESDGDERTLLLLATTGVIFSIAAADVTRYSMPRRKHRLFGSTSPAYFRLPSERAAISRLSRLLDRLWPVLAGEVRMDGRHAILPRAGLLMVLAWSVEQAILLDMQRRDSIVATRQRTRALHRTQCRNGERRLCYNRRSTAHRGVSAC